MFCKSLFKKILLVMVLSLVFIYSFGLGQNVVQARRIEGEALGENQVEIMVLLKDQVDTEKVALEAKRNNRGIDNKKAIGFKVTEALQKKALRDQAPLLRYLEKEKTKGKVSEVKSYYIVNSVYAKVDESIVDKISKRPEVDSIWPNFQIKLTERAVSEIDSPKPLATENVEWNIDHIRASDVWNEYGIDGSGVVVGIIDTGVDWGHEALKEKYRGYDPSNPDNPDHSYNWYDPYYNWLYPDDWEGHGTHCAGIVLGSDPAGNNRIGVAPGAKWIAARGLTDDGVGTSDRILDAMEFMLAPRDKNGVANPAMAPDIVNNSWGSETFECNPIFKGAIKNWRNAGILPVFSAGNSGPETGTIVLPANYQESFSVGATDHTNQLADFTSRGPGACGTFWKPDISAPGVYIRSALSENSSLPGGYITMQGTSMAAPHITGVAALLRSADPTLRVDELESIMKDTAKDLTSHQYLSSPNYGFGYGLVDALKGVEEIIEEEITDCCLTITIDGQGYTEPSPGNHHFEKDTWVEVEATPADAWQFKKWEGGVADPDSSITSVIMDEDKEVTAVFEEKPPVTIDYVILALEGESYIKVDIIDWAIAFYVGEGDPLWDYIIEGLLIGFVSNGKYVDLISYAMEYYLSDGDFITARNAAKELEDNIIDKIEPYNP